MSIPFRAITFEDREKVQDYLRDTPYMNCDLSFANLYNWSFYYQTQIAFHRDMLLVRFLTEMRTRPAYLMPIGQGDFQSVFQDMLHDCCPNSEFLMLMSVTEVSMEILGQLFPERFHVIPNPDYSDYIYLREKMTTLSGKKLQSKRNHINQFERQYPNYVYEPITDENANECMLLENKWFKDREHTEEMKAERRVVKQSLQHYKEIGLSGGAIRIDGEIVAFTLGMPINHDTFDICIEKADADVPGAYAVINRDFARTIPEQYTYLNREEDLGIEGLKRAKMSYKPEMILEKNIVMIQLDD